MDGNKGFTPPFPKNCLSIIQGRAGFTFIEIMLVVVIIGILAAIVLPRLTGRTEQARETAALQQIEIFSVALESFYLDNKRYPTTTEGLNSLMEKPVNAPRWKGPYLRKGVPHDPWDKSYVYISPGVHNRDYDLYSKGANGIEGGGDDITNWSEKK
ncbi:MAG: type II secretion system major pseudopilin GspG [Elusimicrobiota bacterium]